MSNYYSSNPKLYVGIDCIIFGFNEGELNLLRKVQALQFLKLLTVK